MTVEMTRTGGCGCGGAGQSRPTGCAGCAGGCSGGCGTSAATATQQHTYVRPRFFAGQLLTEDDLELLGSYTVAKHKLHNRFLFGAGVVCGLEVTCEPCGGGKVRVAPGYALDCCGSDIVVACPESVDVNELVRELRRVQLGVDCGDPCGDPPGPSRQYYLYLRYDETPAEPVTPYVTDEPCGQQGCEPSRVQEGYRFVLRTDGYGRPQDDFRTRLSACAPPSDTGRDVTHGIERLGRFTRPLLVASEPGAAPGFDADAVAAAAARLPAGQAAAAPAPGEARELTESVRLLVSELVRLQMQDQDTQTAIGNDAQAVDKITKARAALAGAVTTLTGAPEETWPDAMDRETADELLAQAATLADAKAPPLDPTRARMLAQGLPVGPGVLAKLFDSSTDVRTWLLRQLDQATHVTDCGLRAAVAALDLPAPPPATPAGPASPQAEQAAVARAAAASDELMQLVERYRIGCQCSALLPPCPPCTDTDVLLAAIEVRDCEVVAICNVVRDFVISPTAIRYWVPQVRTLQDTLVRSCCGGREVKPVQGVPAVVPAFSDPGRPDRDRAWPTAFGLGDLFPQAPAAPPTVTAALAQPVAATDELSALSARVEELSRLLIETSGKLMTEKGRITKLQKTVSQLPRK